MLFFVILKMFEQKCTTFSKLSKFLKLLILNSQNSRIFTNLKRNAIKKINLSFWKIWGLPKISKSEFCRHLFKSGSLTGSSWKSWNYQICKLFSTFLLILTFPVKQYKNVTKNADHFISRTRMIWTTFFGGLYKHKNCE